MLDLRIFILLEVLTGAAAGQLLCSALVFDGLCAISTFKLGALLGGSFTGEPRNLEICFRPTLSGFLGLVLASHGLWCAPVLTQDTNDHP